ncbi:Gfo/Idh/MocA family protein [Paenibacillus flagellatus]|uniref:Gfo/Idh/MocA family oxidoreductase n=1 Tax=Paenibacillus flagellatus TaxID=2211139 RepID=A0A2V5K2V4_9BACL|nr:Gfo/Idh/MocA family oxidoreductase [Paenibacillus flagellatus]PYI53511.1 gfo/Idh/MocA family oxidoreductase [Paenibacillus flagellatus]
MTDASQTQPNRAEGPVTAIIVGAGHRAILYATYAEKHPDELRIVGVVDPDPVRRRRTAERFGLPEDAEYGDTEELVRRGGKIADAAINGTMDAMHVPTTLPLLAAGYDVLLEKPIGVSREEVLELLEHARRYGRKVMICHVLRYAPFYAEIRKRVAAGEIGDILSVQTAENVSYHHMAMGFVRGKWNSKEKGGSSMLMAKCCHDLDLLTWMKGGAAPVTVASFGGRTYFREERAPEGAGERCLACAIEPTCDYSAKKHYLEQRLWSSYLWPHSHLGVVPSEEEKIESLLTDNPYGRCVWKCDNDVVDHQTVAVRFEDGSTASHNMTGGTSKPCRSIHLIGTKGEIQGVMEDGFFVVRHPDPRAGHEYREERVELNVSNDMHGGGDLRLVEDFVRTLRGEAPSLSSTALEGSIYGHLIGFAADESMESGRTVGLDKL